MRGRRAGCGGDGGGRGCQLAAACARAGCLGTLGCGANALAQSGYKRSTRCGFSETICLSCALALHSCCCPIPTLLHPPPPLAPARRLLPLPGLYLASAGGDQTIVVWDVLERKPLGKRVLAGAACGLAWHPCKNVLAAITEDGGLKGCRFCVCQDTFGSGGCEPWVV